MNIGIDLGYNETKALGGDRAARFPSVAGTPDAGFSLNGKGALALVEPLNVLVGDAAVTQSRFLERREDRAWVQSDTWRACWLTAVTELTNATAVDLSIVAGLPVAFYQDEDKAQVVESLMGEHRVRRAGRHAQALRVKAARVIPQPFGTLLSEVLSNTGRIENEALARQTVGIIDVGGKTCNLLLAKNLNEIAAQTTSINMGGWDLVRAVRSDLTRDYPGLEDMRDAELAKAIRRRQVNYYGEPVPGFGAMIDAHAARLANQILSTAGQLWNGGATLDAVLVTGGGALLLGEHIEAHWRHARTVDNPVMANALGYWKYAQRL
jgi:plasmid segregation protein ParM